MFELKIYLLNLEVGPKKILGIIVGFDLDASIERAESIYPGSRFVDVGRIIDWQEFKSYYDISNWPKDYVENDSGLFSIDEFAEACYFVKDLISQSVERKYDLKIEMSPN